MYIILAQLYENIHTIIIIGGVDSGAAGGSLVGAVANSAAKKDGTPIGKDVVGVIFIGVFPIRPSLTYRYKQTSTEQNSVVHICISLRKKTLLHTFN